MDIPNNRNRRIAGRGYHRYSFSADRITFEKRNPGDLSNQEIDYIDRIGHATFYRKLVA